ncbi:carbonate dehydratase [Erysipelothrix sp. HDW6C]|uniref:carbonic anhydrase n=1 Tax=Erysipelothrix sp. HDW6C TaxID=2714930 RepID=UPI00140C9F6F|nr:carbonic anhydrase [Erysipelothrix sp. HDW6C]QIK70014.1 carbonate dehydratase [Erysipelothrix sp. HDW6C]
MKNEMNWQQSLKELQDGNERFRKQVLRNAAHSSEYLQSLVLGQKPHAVVVSCSDSRVSPDLIFDERLGEIFIIQNAGNIVDDTVIGSIEFAIESLGSALVVVLGHSDCGAVTAASQGVHVDGKLQYVIDSIVPHIRKGETLEQQIKQSAEEMADILRNEPVIKKAGTKVISAYYNINDGSIQWIL